MWVLAVDVLRSQKLPGFSSAQSVPSSSSNEFAKSRGDDILAYEMLDIDLHSIATNVHKT
jgi:hypothetical protein